MRGSRLVRGLLLAGALSALAVLPLMAQDAGQGGAGGGRGGGRGAGGGGGRMDPAAFRARQLDQYKQTLQVTDDEWNVMKPLVDKAMTLSRQASGGRMMGMMGGRRGGGAAGAQPQPLPDNASDVDRKTRDLETTLADQAATPDQIKAKLTALRDARTKAKQELAQVQTQLKELLTQRQEAQLVLGGLLD